MTDPQTIHPRMYWCLAALIIGVVAIGCYGCYLNQLLYEKQAPFYDSMSYHIKLHRVMVTTQQEGLVAGLQESVNRSTVFAPHAVAALLSFVCQPSRLIGVWIQIAELLAMGGSVFYFLTVIQRYRPSVSLVMVSALMMVESLYVASGGLSDFRMDLSLMLLYGTAGVWFLAAMLQPRWLHFIVFGLVVGVSCLFRATAPIYLLLAVTPCAFFFLCFGRERTRKWQGMAVSGLLAASVSGWFYVANYDYLYFYYVVWNTDANAGLSWMESLGHLHFVNRQLGGAFWIWFGVSLIVLRPDLHWSELRSWWTGNRWVLMAMAWFGAAPLLLLIGSGAGLNPFVSFPASIGFGILAVTIIGFLLNSTANRPQQWVVTGVIAIGLLAVLWRGFEKHDQPRWVGMPLHQQIIERIERDAGRHGRERVYFASVETTELSTDSLHATLLFDRPADPILRNSRVRLIPSQILQLPAESDWASVPGSGDFQKVEHLASDADGRIDYLVVLDKPSPQSFLKYYGHVAMNRHAGALERNLKQSRRWKTIGTPLAFNDGMQVQVLRNEVHVRHRQKIREDPGR